MIFYKTGFFHIQIFTLGTAGGAPVRGPIPLPAFYAVLCAALGTAPGHESPKMAAKLADGHRMEAILTFNLIPRN